MKNSDRAQFGIIAGAALIAAGLTFCWIMSYVTPFINHVIWGI